MELVEKMLGGNQQALSRLITLVEKDAPEVPSILKGIHSYTGKAYCVGITGAPGAGKSTLVDKITAVSRDKGLSVGIIAVDPTSPFSGGAVLGDRIRMQKHYLDSGVFIRSMATRGSLTGLSMATKSTIKLLDAFGMDIILLETVGVGQIEVAVMKAVDSVVVVLSPEAGDAIQTMKAGIMEIADIFAVNKADRPGADQMVAELKAMLAINPKHSNWKVPVIATSALDNAGIKELYEAIAGHREFLENSGRLSLRRQEQLKEDLLRAIEQRFSESLMSLLETNGALTALSGKVERGELDLYTAATEFLSNKTAFWDRILENNI